MAFLEGIVSSIIELSNVIGGLLWGWYTQAFLILVGVYMLVGTKFYVFRKFGYIMKNTLGKMFEKTENNTAGLTSVQAVLGALAGTIGMGNIAGTASAISIGGPGAVFWMWLFAFLGMSVKTAEVTLAVHYREVAPDGSSIYGGPMYYMRKAMNAKALSVVFTIGLILNCVFMASTMQTHTIIESVNRAYNINPYLIAAVCVVLASDGYPEKYDKGFEIKGLDTFKDKDGYYVFHAGTKFDGDKIVTNGGRVLGVVAKGEDLKAARANAYKATEWIDFANKYKRNDIGKAIDEA